MLEFIVDDNMVLRKYDSMPERYKVPMYSQNAIEVLFEFDETWQGYTITAQLTKLQSTYNLLLDANNKVLTPSDITEGLWYVSVFGVKGSATRNTTISACLNVVRGGYVTSGTPPVPPAPDLYQQLISQVKTSETNAKASEVAAAQSLQDVNVASTAATSKMETYGDIRYANALIGNKSGILVNVDDAWGVKALKAGVQGESAQVVTTGKNYFSFPVGYANTISGVTLKVESDGILLTGTPTITSDYISFTSQQFTPAFVSGSSYTIQFPENRAGVGIWLGSGAIGGALNYLVADTSTTSKTRVADSSWTANTCTINISFDVGTLNLKIHPQLELGSTATSYEPYTGGNPSPSPEYPQEVDVVDGPVTVRAVGKNLVGSPEADIGYKVHGSYSFTPDYITCVLSQGWAGAYVMFNSVIKASGATFYMSFDKEFDKASALVRFLDKNLNIIPEREVGAIGSYNSYYQAQVIVANGAVKFTVPNDVSFIKVGICFRGDTGDTVTVSNIQLELGSTATPYEPYASSQQTITLPSDHNYLASLPDGTRDELALRADGVAVLTERTIKLASYNGEPITTSYMSTTGQLTTGATIYYATDATTVYSADNGATWSTTDPAAGQSDIPLHEGTNNVWCTDALSPTVDLEYVQDINAVIKKLSAAIVAAGATGV